jgi:Flp pilus assembly protein TadG
MRLESGMQRTTRQGTGFLRRFARAGQGTAAVEFAIIATPFFMLVIGVLELGMLFMASITLDAATFTASRQIRTGQLQLSGTNTAAGFQQAVCANMSWLSSADCNANVVVDVRTFSNFASMSTTPPVTNGALDPSKTTFDSGSACSIVLVRVFYPYTLLAPLLEPGLPNLGPTQRLITSSATFRNEDFAGLTPCS